MAQKNIFIDRSYIHLTLNERLDRVKCKVVMIDNQQVLVELLEDSLPWKQGFKVCLFRNQLERTEEKIENAKVSAGTCR